MVVRWCCHALALSNSETILFESPNSLFLAACAGRLYEFVLYNSYKHCLNWYKNHTVYECVLYNLYYQLPDH